MSVLQLRTLLIGIFATLTMDVLMIVASKLRVTAPLPPELIGRWFATVFRGQPVHSDIAKIPPINHETAIALPVHYTIGIVLTFLFLLGSSAAGLSPHNPVTAFGFALGTSLLPWFVMFPAMGYGWFGLHGPAGTRLLFSSLVNHSFYGAGLWLATSILISKAG